MIQSLHTISHTHTGMAACRNGNVRLSATGSLSQSDGTVEVCVEGSWWMICHTDWDEMDASVICRQLLMNEMGEFLLSL